jgi:hypothetical protein
MTQLAGCSRSYPLAMRISFQICVCSFVCGRERRECPEGARAAKICCVCQHMCPNRAKNPIAACHEIHYTWWGGGQHDTHTRILQVLAPFIFAVILRIDPLAE